MRDVRPVGGNLAHALIAQLAHVDLEGKEREDHQTEDGQRHDLRQLAEGVQQRVDDRLQSGHDGHRLEGAQHAKSAQPRQVAHLHADGGVATSNDHEVQPIPRVSQIRVLVEQKALGNNLYDHFDRVNGQKDVLRLFHGLRHSQEDAVEQNGGHDAVVEELVGGDVDANAPCWAPWVEEEEALGAREAMDVVLPEPLRYYTEGLEFEKSALNTGCCLGEDCCAPVGAPANVVSSVPYSPFPSHLFGAALPPIRQDFLVKSH